MNVKALMDRALFALSVPKCVCCKTRLNYGEKAFCPKCSVKFEENKSRNCSRCSRILSECDCSNEFLRAHYVRRLVKCYRYLIRDERLPGNSLIYSLKRENRSDVLELCVEELSAAIINSVENPSHCLFTNVPRRRAAIVEYGIDHSALLAKALAEKFGANYVPILGSRAGRAQKTLETAERFKNADFYIIKDVDLTGREVIIVDDIITTGASVGKASSLIRSLGSDNIIGASLAIAYRDD